MEYRPSASGPADDPHQTFGGKIGRSNLPPKKPWLISNSDQDFATTGWGAMLKR
jgi:hypothetical protein